MMIKFIETAFVDFEMNLFQDIINKQNYSIYDNKK